MKYVILLADGMADNPCGELGGKTPLEYACTPYMDKIAMNGTLGLINTVPNELSPGSDVANLSVLGYDPSLCFTGRGPLEAASMGVQLLPEDVAFRCNMVTLSVPPEYRIDDFTAEHITSSESVKILSDLQKEIGEGEFIFYPGVGYRHLMVWKNGISDMMTTPPHDITGKDYFNYLPFGPGSHKINQIQRIARDILEDHPVNKKRIERGLKPANSIWLWGQGHIPNIDKISDRYHIKGGMISAVDLLNGIGVYAGLKILRVQGATGYTDTNYLGKGQKALEALKELDLVFVHVEAPDEMGHEGNLHGKIKAIEEFDVKVVGTIISNIKYLGPFRVAVLSDHPTPLEIKTHSREPNPIAILSSNVKENQNRKVTFCERHAKNSGNLISPGHLFINHFLGDWERFVKNNYKSD